MPADSVNKLTHLDDHGRAKMVDVGHKPVTAREATAEGFIVLQPATIEAIAAGSVPKGDVFAAARIAGIMAAKKCGELIPLCHPLGLESVEIAFDVQGDRVRIQATTRITGKTGVEMEALTAVSVAALTIYDMCKSLDKQMVIEGVRVLSKRK
ncbi:MAG: cyclic pyranopterin monophosphate synthase MoaC [Tepidisphaeraceae bacterium]